MQSSHSVQCNHLQRFRCPSALTRAAVSARVVCVVPVEQACSYRAVAERSRPGSGRSPQQLAGMRVAQTIGSAAQARVYGECGKRCVHWNAGHRVGWLACAARCSSQGSCNAGRRRQAQAGAWRPSWKKVSFCPLRAKIQVAVVAAEEPVKVLFRPEFWARIKIENCTWARV